MLEEIALPETLEDIGGSAFYDCPIKTVWVKSGCSVCVSETVSESVQILPEKSTMVGKTLLQDLR